MENTISLLDTIIIFVYLIIVLSIGLKIKIQNKDTVEYFLAGRNLNWFVVGLSLFATNISSEHFIGLAGSGATRGLAVGQFELIAIFFLIILGWIIAPIYKRMGIFTATEFLELRFDIPTKKFFSAISIFTYLVSKIFVTLFAGGILFNRILGWSIFSSASVIVLITGIYTLVGGYVSVVRTQVFQAFFFFMSAILFFLFGLYEVGGINSLITKLPSEYFQMFKPVDDPDFPWTGIIFGAPIIAFWYWCADNYIVQRILSAKSINDARSGTLLTAFLKIFPIFILVMPGLIAAALFPGIQGDEAYPVLLSSNIIPIGIRGFIIAGFLAAMMSSLSSAFNTISQLYTIDFYKPKHPNASERTLVLVGRMVTIFIVVFVLLIVPFVKLINNQIYIFLQSTQAFISAPITAIFVSGMIFKRISSKSAFMTLIVGEFLGLSRFIIELMMKSELISNPILLAYAKINYLHFTIFLFLFSLFMLFVFNFLFHEYNVKISQGLLDFSTYYNENVRSLRFSIFISGIILILTISLWYLFM
ncbi:MAG: sodium/solute symporter [Melioribacter sp.]|nr:sodium/solute symporter [Melioribacter sp.]